MDRGPSAPSNHQSGYIYPSLGPLPPNVNVDPESLPGQHHQHGHLMHKAPGAGDMSQATRYGQMGPDHSNKHMVHPQGNSMDQLGSQFDGMAYAPPMQMRSNGQSPMNHGSAPGRPDGSQHQMAMQMQGSGGGPGAPVQGHGPNQGPIAYTFHQVRPQSMGRGPQANHHEMGGMGMQVGMHQPGPVGGHVNDHSVHNGANLDAQMYGSMGEHEIDGGDIMGANLRRRHKAARMSIAQRSPNTSTGSEASEDPDSELKRIALDSLRYPLERAVAHVREDDNGPLAEKSRQVFGMSWLLRSCEGKPEANVPRNRIYARYVSVCTEFNLKPLNPASFGKLVRAVFPDIKTRRLGVRGKSKYHYCGVTLIAELNDSTGGTPNASMVTARSPSPPGSASVGLGTPMNDATGEFYVSSPHTTASGVKEESVPANFRHEGNAKWFERPSFDPNVDFVPPDIKNYLQTEHDEDISQTLYGLYKSHGCTLISKLRQMQPKPFLNLVSGFPTSLTVPVQRMLQSDEAIAWIADGDRILYRIMIQILAPLDLQEVAPEIHETLRFLVANLPDAIEQTHKTMCDAYIQSKLASARPFLNLIDRLLRVNESAQNVTHILASEHEVARMKQDWQRLVTETPVREAPCAAGITGAILREEIPHLLGVRPGDASNGQDLGSVVGSASAAAAAAAAALGARSGANGELLINEGSNDPIGKSTTNSSRLEVWTHYLRQIPPRLPATPPRLFLLGVSAVATAALRDISRGGGESFGAWWVLRCWIDEWLAWSVETTQFLTNDSVEETNVTVSPQRL